MAQNTYTVTAPNGKSLSITGDKPPTEQELDEIFTAANVQADSKTPPKDAARLFRPRTEDELKQSTEAYRTDLIDPKDRNIFNQDISTSFKQGAEGVYQAGKNLVGGVANMVIDPVKRGYEASNPFVTLGELLNAPKKLRDSGTQGAKDLIEKSKNAKSMSERLAYGALSPIPWLGPAVASIGEQFGSGNPEQMGEATLNTLALLEGSPSFRALTTAGKAEAIAAVKSGVSRIPVPAIVKKTVLNVVENPGVALTGAYGGYKEGGTLGAVVGAFGAPSGYNSALKLFGRKTAAEIAEERAYNEAQVEKRNRRLDANAATRREQQLTDRAEKLASDATLLADERAYTSETISAKQQADLFRLQKAHTDRLERDVLQAGTKADQNKLRRSQQVGDMLESREHAAKLAAEKAVEKSLESERQDALRMSREGTTEAHRQEGFARADAIRARQETLALEKETRTRNNALSDAANRNARRIEIATAHTAAQLSNTHLSNVESMLKAQTPDALNSARQVADYHLELADSLDPDVRAALKGKIDQVFETQSATMAERLAAQNEQLQGLESKGIRATRSSSAQDASGNRQRVTEAFSEPAPAEEPVPQQGAPASRPASAPKGSAPKTKPSGKVTPDNVLEQLNEQAQRETASGAAATTEEQIKARVKSILAGDVLVENMAEKDPRIRFAWDQYHAKRQGMKSAARNVAEPVTNREAQVSVSGGKNLNAKGEVENLPFGQRRKDQ